MIEIDSDWFTKLLDFDTLWHNTWLQALLPFQICNLNDWSQSSSGSTAKCLLPLKYSRIVWLMSSHVASAWAENSSEEINVVTPEFFKTLTNFDQYQPSNILKSSEFCTGHPCDYTVKFGVRDSIGMGRKPCSSSSASQWVTVWRFKET